MEEQEHKCKRKKNSENEKPLDFVRNFVHNHYLCRKKVPYQLVFEIFIQNKHVHIAIDALQQFEMNVFNADVIQCIVG
jgi:hypothetical protein